MTTSTSPRTAARALALLYEDWDGVKNIPPASSVNCRLYAVVSTLKLLEKELYANQATVLFPERNLSSDWAPARWQL
eukprot:1391602-Amorphochlora_amoeboformis.AAC.1